MYCADAGWARNWWGSWTSRKMHEEHLRSCSLAHVISLAQINSQSFKTNKQKCKKVQLTKLFLDLYICSKNFKIRTRMTNSKFRTEFITGKTRRVKSRHSQGTPIVSIMWYFWKRMVAIMGIYYIMTVLIFLCVWHDSYWKKKNMKPPYPQLY